MMKIDFEKRFNEFSDGTSGNQKLLNSPSPISIYYGVGTDGCLRLSFMSTFVPPKIESTKLLKVSQGKESEGVYWTCFDLLKPSAKQVFYTFCNDLVGSIYGEKSEQNMLLGLKNRYFAWKSMFKQEIVTLSNEKIKGLFGELYFIKIHMLSSYGADNAIEAWSGPDGYSKDFSIKEDWYEVKTISSEANIVKISSLSQLSSNTPGYLVIIRVESMSEKFDDGEACIYDLFDHILSKIKSDDIREKFISKLVTYGFDFSDSSSKLKFKVISIDKYIVNNDFPRILEKDIKFQEISKISYELIINTLNKYRES